MTTDREALVKRLTQWEEGIQYADKIGVPLDSQALLKLLVDCKATITAQGGEQTDTVSVPSDAEMLNWLQDNHYFSGARGVDRDAFTWEFHTPNNGRQWQPLREKIAEAMLAAERQS